jgi:hypothetical protein
MEATQNPAHQDLAACRHTSSSAEERNERSFESLTRTSSQWPAAALTEFDLVRVR